MRIAPLADVKARLSAYIEQSQTEGPIVITRNGKAVAVLVAAVNDDDVESLVLARSPRLQKLLKKSRDFHRSGSLRIKSLDASAPLGVILITICFHLSQRTSNATEAEYVVRPSMPGMVASHAFATYLPGGSGRSSLSFSGGVTIT